MSVQATKPRTMNVNEMAGDFLAQKRIAVVGVSESKQSPANLIYKKLKGLGYSAIPVSPHLTSFQGDPCFSDLGSIPGGVDGVVAVTRPDVTGLIARQCADAGINRIWMHQSLASAGTSVSAEAVTFCREHGIQVIAGACPMMFCEPVDFGHRCMRWMLSLTGGMPKGQPAVGHDAG